MLLGLSFTEFSASAPGWEVRSSIPPSLESHVKPSLRLSSLRSCRIFLPSDYESKGTESSPMSTHTHTFISGAQKISRYTLNECLSSGVKTIQYFRDNNIGQYLTKYVYNLFLQVNKKLENLSQ